MRTSRNSQRGYALIIMIVLLTMGLLYGVVSQLSLVGAKVGRAQGTQTVLVQAKEALIGFAATYRDNNSTEVFGYLPCPDTVGDGLAHPPCGSAGATVVGLLPYRTLGLEDLRDSANVCLWYVVSGTFKDNPKTTPLNWDTQGKIAIQDANGNTVVAANDASGGAAAVIIAVGRPLNGQSRSTATNTCGAVASAAQVAAYLDGGYAFPYPGPVTLREGSSENSSNNDLMLAVTPKEIFSRIIPRADFKNSAAATPPGQINALSDSIKRTIEKQIQSNLKAGTSPTLNALPDTTGGYTTISGKQIGNIATGLTLTSTSDQNYLANWRNQYRYVVCSALSTPCLDIAGTNCRAALMLGGRSTTSGPRSSTQNVSTPASLGNFFEAGKGLELLTTSTTTFSGNTSYMDSTNPNAAPSDDVGICLFPGAFKSFAQDIAEFSDGRINSGSGGNVLANVDSVTKTLTLGSSSGIAGVGCVWDANVLPMSSSLRLYFRLNFATKGNGLALALADGATNLAPNNGARSQIMCGASGSDTLGYSGIPPAAASGIPPAGTTVGIKSPKLGIEFDTRYDSSRNDPYTDHMAFLYWGNAADNVAGGSGTDDNTHYLGTGGVAITAATWAGNVVTVTTASAHGLVGSVAITAATWAGNIATVTTASSHGFSVGGVVHVSGITPSAYNGTYTILTSSSTQFTYTLIAPSNPGNLTVPGSVGEVVIVSGITPGAYNGTYTVLTSTSTQFTYALPLLTDPGSLNFYLGSGGPLITTATWASNVATLTTASAHGLSPGDVVLLSGLAPTDYNGTHTVTTSTTNQFTYALSLSSNPGSLVRGTVKPVSAGPAPRNPRIATALRSPSVSGATWSFTSSGGQVTITTSTAHNLSVGQKVYVSGITPAGYNGVYKVLVSGLTTVQFSYLLSTNPGFYVSGGSIPAQETEISALNWSSNTAHANTTPDNHGFSSGQTVAVAGATPGGYNAGGTVTSLSSKLFDYPLATDPVGNFLTETPTGMSILKNSATAPHNYFRHTSIPRATSVYVRLDISRSYDSTHHIAVLNTKAYIGDTFGSSPDLCSNASSGSEFQDLTQDLADLCPFRTVTLQQDSIPISAIATLSGATWSSSTVSATTVAAHRLVNGATITISGASPAPYNGTYAVAVTGANTFTYNLPVDPGSYVSGGDIQPLSTIYFGFTNARGTTSSVEDQSVTIDQLLLRSQ